jgi:sugar-specific transcriptional regulator TrmB
MSEHELVTALTAHGFSLNEARAYVALVGSGAATGYEVGQRASIPRSAVYSSLRRLQALGAARAIAGSPERFVAIAPDEVIDLLRSRFERDLAAIERAAASLEAVPAVPDAFTVQGYERVIEEASRLVRSARDQLVVSGWPRELSLLAADLAAAVERGVYTVVFSHALLPRSVAGLHFSSGFVEAELEAFWRHRLFVVADDERSLVGATEQSKHDSAVLTGTAAIAEVVTSQITLDITLLAQRHGYDVEKVMARILRDRVGRLDELGRAEPTLGVQRGRAKRERARAKR